MALDTTVGGANADSYVSAAAADAYFTAQGVDAALWGNLSTTKKESALRKATAFLDAMFTYSGLKATLAQRLQWPRSGVIADGYYVNADVLPRRLTDACNELALRATTADLAPDLCPQLVTAEQVGPLATEYSEHQRNSGRTLFDFVEGLLSELVLGGSNNIRVVRA